MDTKVLAQVKLERAKVAAGSWKKLAARTGLPDTTLRSYHTGDRHPISPNASALLELGIELDDWFTPVEPPRHLLQPPEPAGEAGR